MQKMFAQRATSFAPQVQHHLRLCRIFICAKHNLVPAPKKKSSLCPFLRFAQTCAFGKRCCTSRKCVLKSKQLFTLICINAGNCRGKACQNLVMRSARLLCKRKDLLLVSAEKAHEIALFCRERANICHTHRHTDMAAKRHPLAV